MQARSRNIIAIPAKNEEARIGLCLDALSRQARHFDHLLLLLNNCTDDTLSICENFIGRFENVTIRQCDLQGNLASAGEARRLALDAAADLAGDGVILTTDADAVPADNWVSKNLRAMARGADVVCGMARLNGADNAGIPRPMRIDGAREARLMSIQDEIAAMIDPDPCDPWPRHQQHSGASLAVRAASLRQAGGPPHVATGEDRALVERLALVDARIRHAPEISVTVSGRLEGRAEGGMADTMKRRMQQRDVFTDERLEPAIDAYRRALAKARLRAVVAGRESAGALSEDLLIHPAMMRRALEAPYFGGAWADIQRSSPVLQRRRVEFRNLQREISQALALRDHVRAESAARRTPRQHDDIAGNLSSDENAR